MASAAKKVCVLVGGASKHDKGGTAAELPAESRFGLGGALALRFAKGGFHVVILGRRKEVCEMVVAEVQAVGGAASAVACDVSSDDSVGAAFAEAKSLGEVSVVIYNCAPGFPEGMSFQTLPPPHEVDPTFMQTAFNVGVTGCVRCAAQVMPEWLERGSGSFLLSSATMALRGGSRFAIFAPVKAALRSYGQSMFQEYAPKGIHVASVVIDGVIDSPNTHEWGNVMDPAAIAEQYWQLHAQPASVWSYELQITPAASSVGMRM